MTGGRVWLWFWHVPMDCCEGIACIMCGHASLVNGLSMVTPLN